MMYSAKPLAQFVIAFLAFVILLTSTVSFVNVAAAEEKIDLYIAPKTEYLPIGELLSYLLDSRFDLEVNEKIQYLDIGLRKIANGKGDLFIGLKLPPAREVSWNYSLYQLCDLGPIYEDVISGLATPAYVPEEKLSSPEDLAGSNIKARLHDELIVYESEEKLLEEMKKLTRRVEGLGDYKLVELGEMVANSELNRATRNNEWLITTLKRPSIPFSLYDMRFIEELTEGQSVHLFGRRTLVEKYSSRVTQFLSRFYLPIELINELIRLHDEDKRSAARKFVDEHPALVDYWVKGVAVL
ncbi:hypothetical protein K9M06_01360 [Candidatus Bipolaricaulota bacterium]|nr:hypothetical protein [Candidatus Bipolaricaulota bacterium]